MIKIGFPKMLFTLIMVMVLACNCGKPSDPVNPSNTDTTASTPPDTVANTANTGFEVLDYLYKISGSKTVAGVHNREPNSTPAAWTNKVYSVTGKYPGFWSGDFLFQQDNINNRQIMINEAMQQWKKGAIVQLMWHACNPALKEPCEYDSNGVLSSLNDDQWAELTTDGTALNKKWKQMIDEVCVYLQQLKDSNVEVLWRPLHEMNQGDFWWGGRPGADGTRKLYQQMHDYMTDTKGLTNLIWVWDLQDFGTLSSDITAYNPGSDYWDVAALDVYDGSGYTAEKYNTMANAAGGKPIAIGECEKLPTAVELTSQPKWVFFMGWSELEFQGNTNAELKSLHTAENVITLDEMPGW